jgi:hypothetical protein
MRMFDSRQPLMRAYLHMSYAMSMVVMTLLIRQLVDIGFGHAQTLNLLTKEFLISLVVATLLVSVLLYLHLPKMINRCFTIGRQFGL